MQPLTIMMPPVLASLSPVVANLSELLTRSGTVRAGMEPAGLIGCGTGRAALG